MKTVAVILANGMEELEALTPVDVLRRAGARVRVYFARIYVLFRLFFSRNNTYERCFKYSRYSNYILRPTYGGAFSYICSLGATACFGGYSCF